MENLVRKILAGCRKNERRSQKEFYQLFYEFVFAICYRYESEWNTVEKLVSDSFIKVFKKVNEFEDGQFADTYVFRSIKIWIKQYVLFACIENCRQYIRTHDIRERQTEFGYSYKFPVANISTFSNKQIIEAIRKLPIVSRVSYNLCVIDGMPLEQMAIFLGISIIDLQSILANARESLRNYLSIEEYSGVRIIPHLPNSRITGDNRLILLPVKSADRTH